MVLYVVSDMRCSGRFIINTIIGVDPLHAPGRESIWVVISRTIQTVMKIQQRLQGASNIIVTRPFCIFPRIAYNDYDNST